MSLLDALMQIERSLWTNDAAIYAAAYLDDAILIFPDVGRIALTDALDAIRAENRAGRHWADTLFQDAAVLEAAPGAAVLSYRAIARWNDEAAPSRVLCATLYVWRDECWRVALHQQTNA